MADTSYAACSASTISPSTPRHRSMGLPSYASGLTHSIFPPSRDAGSNNDQICAVRFEQSPRALRTGLAARVVAVRPLIMYKRLSICAVSNILRTLYAREQAMSTFAVALTMEVYTAYDSTADEAILSIAFMECQGADVCAAFGVSESLMTPCWLLSLFVRSSRNLFSRSSSRNMATVEGSSSGKPFSAGASSRLTKLRFLPSGVEGWLTRGEGTGGVGEPR